MHILESQSLSGDEGSTKTMQEDREAASVYWKSALAGCQAISFPTLPPAVQQPVAETTTTYQCLPLVRRPSDVTISTIVYGAWAIVASYYTNMDDVVFGATITGRKAYINGAKVGVEPDITVVPVRVCIRDDAAVSCFLHNLQQQEAQMTLHKQTGLEQIAKVSADAKHACQFQTLLTLQSASGKGGKETIGEWHSQSKLQDFTKFALLWDWNRNIPPTTERCIHDLFTEQAKARPTAPAICAWDGEMTYGELDTLSSRLASHLVDLGVEPEVIVPLCFEKSMWVVVAMLAVLKAGGAFLLLDPSLPRERLKLMCRKASGSIALSSQASAMVIDDLVSTLVIVNRDSICRTSSQASPPATVKPGNTAYVIFTSGSTGEPKGCRVEHQAACSSAVSHGHILGIHANTRTLQFASYSFAVSLVEMLNNFIHGGCICILSEEERRMSLGPAMSRMRVSWACLTSTVLDLITPDAVPSLDVVCVGGDPIRRSQIMQWEARVHLRQSYGSNIGPAITGVFWIVDPNDHERLLPIGAVGEILIEGPALGREYIDEPEKTAASFIEAPAWRASFGQNNRSRRLYKTGDLARYKKDGSVELMGRKDNQVKLRGQRIELGEIEHQVRQAKCGVKGAVAELIRPRDSVDDLLACFIILDNNPDNEMNASDENTKYETDTQKVVQQVQEKLDQFLPQYMVPSAFVRLPHLPLTWSGKIDRRKIREIGASFSTQQLLAELRTQSQGPTKRQPITAIEQAMQQLWAQVLFMDMDTIGLDDSFFRLGGDSIAAMKLVAEARRLGMQLTVADVFRSPKLCQLSIAATASVTDSPTTIPRVQHIGPASQSFAQGRLWFLEELYPGLNWYSMPLMVRIKGSMRLEALKSALLAVESRHETLRTTFDTINGVGSQIVRPFCSKDINVIELPAGDEQRLTDALKRDQATPFNLRLEPGWRATIYHIGKDEHVLSIVMHHVISDGWSLDVLTRELAAFYFAATQGQDPLAQVQPLPIQYCDFSLWQREQAQAENHQKQLSYWVRQLQGNRPAELPCDKPRPAALSGQAGVRTIKIDGSLYDNLQRFCKLHGTTHFVALLAAFRTTHFRLTGQGDATIGTPNANRDRWEVKDMIGFFVNLQCLRISVGEETFKGLVDQVHNIVVASHANADVPFESIVSKLKNDRDLSRHPFFQIVFAVHAQQDFGQLKLDGLETEVVSTSANSRFDLEFHFYQQADGLQGSVLFSTDLYAPETIDNMLSIFHVVLETCLKEPETVVASLPLLSDAHFQKLDEMGLIQVEETAYPRDSSIVDLFRQQASVCPSRVAVQDASAKMTYAQLDEASDTLAWWLSKRALAPDTLVGVLANRSCEAIIAFLGILKANLAYLPLDSKAPTKRIEAILSSLPGHTILLTGADIPNTNIQLSKVEFFGIGKALTEVMDNFITQQSMKTIAGPSSTSLAYVMFTSGSTGQPKGVMVEHRGIVRLVRDNNLVQYLPDPPVMAHMANLAFDASTWEIYAPLLNGGTIVCIGPMAVLDPEVVLQIFRLHHVQSAFMTPTLMGSYAKQLPAIFTGIEMLCVGGEALEPHHIQSIENVFTGKLVNSYGPTENSAWSTLFLVTKKERSLNGVPIGRALSNSGAYVMDSKLTIVPLGIVGELVVTGDGVARGYTDPSRDIDRFISITIGGQTVRAYRTGDFARWRPTDGELEYFGRMDGQVKIRGNRVELSEIEHVLHSHKSVSEAVVVVQQQGGEARLAAFVTANESTAIANSQHGNSGESNHVDAWETKFESELYSPISVVQPESIGRDFVSWTSMFDGTEIDKGEMNEWLDDTIHTILETHRPDHVLEIGSGTGMILFNLGDGLQSYVGLEPSQKAINFITESVKSMPVLSSKVQMHKATAADVGHLETPIIASLVIVNSVVQYFPSVEYLFKTVQQLLKIGTVRTIYFGDIRSYALHREFLVTRSLHIASGKATRADIQRMVTDMERVERELLVDPGFFTSLPDYFPDLIEHVEILPKKMRATNELSCYRYAAVVHVKETNQQTRDIRSLGDGEWIDFVERQLERQSLQELLRDLPASATIAVSNIPYSKTIIDRCVIDALGETEAKTFDHEDWLSEVHQRAQSFASLSPIDLVELAREANCQVEISWNRQFSQRGGLDVIFHRYPQKEESRIMFRFPTDHSDRPLHSLGSKPLQHNFLQKIPQELLEIAEGHLPAYMVPQTITVLDAMPMNQNGKVDRKALAERIEVQNSHRESTQQLMSAGEKTMQQLWAQVLGINAETIGLDDSFFRLGGDSIAAMKLVSEARKQGIQLTVASIFHSPKLIDLVASAHKEAPATPQYIEPFSLLSLNSDTEKAQIQEEVAAGCGLDRGLVEDIYPCSPLQEGLMSLTSRRAGDYIMQSVLELHSDIDEGAFRAAWEQVVLSSAVLRTRIVQHSMLGLLQAVVAEGIQWAEFDDLQAYLAKDKSTTMQVGDPLARYAIVKEHGGEKRWFVWTIHHTLYDGWSLPRILNAVGRAYRETAVEKPTGFNAFIQHLGQQDQEAITKYWQATLADFNGTLFPPLSTSSSAQQPVANAMLEYQCAPLPKTASNTTMSTLIRAAWAIVTGNYTNSDDVVFGTTVMGRNTPVPGIEAMLGPTIATVPVRVRFQKELTVQALLDTVQRHATEMIPYEQTGLHRIAKMGVDAQHACSFQSLVVVQPADSHLEMNKELGTWHSRSEIQDFTTYALMVQCTLAAEGVHITASFDPRAIGRWQLEKIMGQFSFVMKQMAEADASTTIADINLLSSKDKQQLWEWNAKVPAMVERCVHGLFMEQARARPTAPAICAWDGETTYGEITYGELDALSSRLASYLIDLGVGPEVIVPLCFEKSMWTVVAMLAVLKAGGAFAPLDPEHPPSRHEEIFRQTKARVVLASEQYTTLCKREGRVVVTVSKASVHRLLSEASERKVHPDVQPGNSAYVIFTSGSTGTPKGVVVEHQAIVTSSLGHGEALGFTQDSRVLQFSSYTFDACIAEIWTTLIHGGCTCVPSERDRRNSLSEAISRMSVTWVFLTPTVARLLDAREIASVSTLAVGGELIRSTDWDLWEGHVRLIHVYGPTECCVYSTAYFDINASRPAVIGKSIASVSWVVDPDNHHRLAPLGSVGELLIEGPILARGYLDDMEKTAAAFVSDPAWLLEIGRTGRVYKTGDLVFYNADGDLVYVGRKDGQVKIRGQRVELGEIEHHVRECMPAVEQVAAEVITPGNKKDKAVVAIFVQQDNVSTEGEFAARVFFPTNVDDQLSERLPSHMLPGVYIKLSKLPTMTSGKTDRRRLREIGASFSAQQLAELRMQNQGPKRQPVTAIEQTLQQLWAQVLGIDADTIGLDDNFLRLGGDSIAAMKLVAEARKQDIHLTVAMVFRASILHDLATLSSRSSTTAAFQPPASFSLLSSSLYEAVVSSGTQCRPFVALDRVEDIRPVSFIQEHYLSYGERNSRDAFNYIYLDLDPFLDVGRLENTCRSLTQHFKILRTHFSSYQGQYLQMVLRDFDAPFSTFEVNGSMDGESNAIVLRDVCQSSPLGAPTSFIFIRNASKAARLFIRLSHAQYDGWCIPVILNTLTSLFNSKSLSPDIDFSTYLAYSRQRAPVAACYWKHLLKGSRLTQIIPKLSPKACADSPLNIKLGRSLPLPQLPGDITIASLVSSAWALVLSAVSGEEDVVYAQLVGGRNSDIPGITEIVGPCINIVPVRADVSSAKTVANLLHSVQEQYVSIGEADSMGFNDIVEQCTNWPAGTMFDSYIKHQNIDANPEIHIADGISKVQWFDNPFVVAPELSIVTQAQAGSLHVTINANTHILTAECADKLLDLLCETTSRLSINLEMTLESFKSSTTSFI
ncbi:hypothetical protein COCMIDRAFT_41693 [Bipolaris oryzae ATCC 44560]|uniref:Nonribosomal peptide synthetase 6 n=1 Tax=Bipolaris oryzae ATCC 44560 TaxID=930090 RepID=W6YWH5_COCMI|nr:uncharacterized protein COCMIDRAFT_41693 [Bipolaris oryzae ATCC 44560]EUC39879.1 hypothetical protein COCMIDRAFT_41693 [Bipolaris oryzae ATCC 44560]